MNINEHRKAIVKAIIVGCNSYRNLPVGTAWRDIAFYNDSKDANVLLERHGQRDICAATHMFFPDSLSQMQITASEYGTLWMGLWLDCELHLDNDDNTLFPRWLAEVLNEMCNLGIREKDIYDVMD